MKLSILTATYNRGNYLNRLFESIVDNLIQELHIEWLIMDDGSVDNTFEIVEQLKKKVYNNKQCYNLEIKYFKQNNQGKMKAINNLMDYVTGEMVMDCDSDDYFINNAFKQIFEKKDVLLNDNSLYALVFLKNENSNKLSGNLFDRENERTTMFDMYFKHGIVGEKILVFNTEIRKQFKHEIENSEKFITEARLYHKMDDNFRSKVL